MYIFTCLRPHSLHSLGLPLNHPRRHQFPTRSDIICHFSVTDLFRSELNDREIENRNKQKLLRNKAEKKKTI